MSCRNEDDRHWCASRQLLTVSGHGRIRSKSRRPDGARVRRSGRGPHRSSASCGCPSPPSISRARTRRRGRWRSWAPACPSSPTPSSRSRRCSARCLGRSSRCWRLGEHLAEARRHGTVAELAAALHLARNHAEPPLRDHPEARRQQPHRGHPRGRGARLAQPGSTVMTLLPSTWPATMASGWLPPRS
jgi:hypothetical protein